MGRCYSYGTQLQQEMMQVLAGSKQKELGVGSMGLMAEYTPIAFVMLCVLVAVMEPMGDTTNPNTLLGFKYTPLASHLLMPLLSIEDDLQSRRVWAELLLVSLQRRCQSS